MSALFSYPKRKPLYAFASADRSCAFTRDSTNTKCELSRTRPKFVDIIMIRQYANSHKAIQITLDLDKYLNVHIKKYPFKSRTYLFQLLLWFFLTKSKEIFVSISNQFLSLCWCSKFKLQSAVVAKTNEQMEPSKIKCRKTIHRDTHANSANNSTQTNYDSEKELSDGFESNPTNQENPRDQSNIQNDSIKSLNDSGKHVRSPSSSRYNEGNSMRLESADGYGGKAYIVLLCPIIIGIALIINPTRSPKSKQCSFLELQNKYPKEGDYLWKNLQYGNEDILNSKSDKPAVFLFVHQDKDIAKTLINDIAETSSRCFGSSVNIKHIDFTSKEAIEDYGHIIATYKESIDEGNVILIANLNKIPGKAAKALHSICDTVTPLVKKVIILLSLTVEQNNYEEKLIDTAENALRQLWQTQILPNELEPIITRVTDQVLLLQSN